MSRLWVHDESLGLAGKPQSFFIMDWNFYMSRGWSAKRVYFILSVLRNSGVQIIQGDTLAVLKDLSETQQRVRVSSAKDPYLSDLIASASKQNLVFIDSSLYSQWLNPIWQDRDLTRFSRFWNRVRNQL